MNPEPEPEPSSEPEPQYAAEAEADVDEDDKKGDEESKHIHTEIQWKLVWLGSKMNLSVSVANDDRNKSYEDKTFTDIPGMLPSIPARIRAKVPSSTELIDVLWLDNDKIVAAFEIEHSTSIDSGLLRMSDMLVTINNKDLPVLTYVVALADRLREAQKKINRPTFRATGLAESCRFIQYDEIRDKFQEVEENGTLCYEWQELLDEIGHKL